MMKDEKMIVGVWVPVEEGMPDDETTVLVWADGEATLAYHDSDVLEERRGDTGWVVAASCRVLRNVTHWCGDILPPVAGEDFE